MPSIDHVDRWVAALEARHLADLTFSEVARALPALFYGPLHYLLVREITRALGPDQDGVRTLIDLGCGTGVAGAAWAENFRTAPAIVGIDRSSWALAEAARTYREFGLKARIRSGDLAAIAWPKPPVAVVAAYSVNELADTPREAVLQRLVDRGIAGDAVLVIEPLAGFVAPWWKRWRDRFESAGGREDEWRFRAELPDIVAKLDRAAGLDHRELTGRSLFLRGRSG
jgi:hypothetical protein